jgi:hypothetical protein
MGADMMQLEGGHIRLEPLDYRNVDGLVVAAAARGAGTASAQQNDEPSRGHARRFGALLRRRNARRIGAAPNAGDFAGSRAAVVRRRGGAAAPRAGKPAPRTLRSVRPP